MKTKYKVGDILVLNVDKNKILYYVYGFDKKFRPTVAPSKTTATNKIIWDGDTTYTQTLHWSKNLKTWQIYGLPITK